MASSTKVKFDKKGNLSVENGNLLESARKDFKECLKINAFIVSVEVPMDEKVTNEKEIIEQVTEGLDEIERQLYDFLKDLNERVEKLLKEEKAGKKTAADEAKKAVDQTEKKIKDVADELGVFVRKTVQKEVSRQLGGKKLQLRSTSRNTFRGVDLQKFIFEGGSSDAENSPFFLEVGKTMSTMGKEIFKKAAEEKTQRGEIVGELNTYVAKFAEAKKANTALTMSEFYKANAKLVKSVEDSGKKYSDFLAAYKDAIEKIEAEFAKLETLIKSDDELKKDSNVKKITKSFTDAAKTIVEIVDPRTKMITSTMKTLKSAVVYSTISDQASDLEKLKGVTKSAKAIEEAGKEFEAMGKAMDK
ncbi:hypothetical protein Psta_1839 [Pirellula staleyi DSM 6068]|uniref:Uncharacterized protein n=1 Tax=Pirellula staleyi (strain ATCC 27377 / DSM 6068 / ICPB 4128) TaxID=530564 RepID=D2QZN0_PIRSD|nr:hypothetical protein [Pirellula staleyi]ADB16513.1 hypothetical protein Psta_1839 [Pirellula staleyi DSM 6068]